MNQRGTERLMMLLAAAVLLIGASRVVMAQFAPGGRGAGPGWGPPDVGPGQNFNGDNTPGAIPSNPAQLGPPPFLIDADTPFERPVQTIVDTPLFGSAPVAGSSGPVPGEHMQVNSGPAAMGRALARLKEMTELPAGIGFIGGAGIKPKTASRGARAGGPPRNNTNNATGRNPATPPPAPPPPAGVLDQTGVTLIRPLSSAGTAGD